MTSTINTKAPLAYEEKPGEFVWKPYRRGPIRGLTNLTAKEKTMAKKGSRKGRGGKPC